MAFERVNICRTKRSLCSLPVGVTAMLPLSLSV
jgi:hypothetical protein